MSDALTGLTGSAPAAPPIDPGLYHFDDDSFGRPSFQSVLSGVSSEPAQSRQSDDRGVQPPPDLPNGGGHDGGAAGGAQAVVHQGLCAVAGAVLGGAGGAFLGAVGEGLAGAGAGTLIEPGGGTLLFGGAGLADGAKNGALAGSAAGAALGAHLCGGDTSPSTPSHIMQSRSDPGLTQPTGPIGGVPTGQRSTTSEGASPERKAQVDSENQVADKTAAAGYPTVQSPTEGPNPPLTPERMAAEGLNPGKKPDLLLSNRVFDIYTPEADNAIKIRRGIAAKVESGQTHRVVVDLRSTTQTQSSIRAALHDNPVPGLKEVITLSNEGLGQPFRP